MAFHCQPTIQSVLSRVLVSPSRAFALVSANAVTSIITIESSSCARFPFPRFASLPVCVCVCVCARARGYKHAHMHTRVHANSTRTHEDGHTPLPAAELLPLSPTPAMSSVPSQPSPPFPPTASMLVNRPQPLPPRPPALLPTPIQGLNLPASTSWLNTRCQIACGLALIPPAPGTTPRRGTQHPCSGASTCTAELILVPAR